MRPDLPTGSVTGQRGWQWNEWQTEGETRTEGANRTDRSSVEEPVYGRRQRPDECVRAEVRALKTELERQKRRRHHVIQHYERLLNEKNRQLSDQESEKPSSSELEIVSTIRRWIPDR